jgi:hypothetical protein
LRGFDPDSLGATKSQGLRARHERQHEALEESRDGKVSIEDFNRFRAGLGARAVAVVNVFTGTPEKSAAWVRHAKEQGYAIAGWELGNELYLPNYRNRLASPKAYIDSAKKHAQAMRAVDKSIRLAVPAHAGLGVEGPSRYAERWNAALAADPFFDAYALHPYVRIEDNFDEAALAGDFRAVAAHLYAASHGMLTEGLARFEQHYGDRGIWLTEWNLMDHKGMAIAGTRLHALFTGDFFVLLAAPGNRVEYAALHLLAGGWNGYPLVTPAGQERGGSVRRSAYASMLLVGEALDGASRSLGVSVNNAPALADPLAPAAAPVPAIVAAAFERGTDLAVLVSNRSDGPVTLQMRLRDGAPLRLRSSASFVGGDLRARSLFQKGDVQRAEIAGGSVQLPPFSFTLLIGR